MEHYLDFINIKILLTIYSQYFNICCDSVYGTGAHNEKQTKQNRIAINLNCKVFDIEDTQTLFISKGIDQSNLSKLKNEKSIFLSKSNKTRLSDIEQKIQSILRN